MTTFATKMTDLANQANNRLALALDAQTAQNREVTAALAEQREVMAALRAISPDHYESNRGVTLESRAQGRAFLGQNGESE